MSENQYNRVRFACSATVGIAGTLVFGILTAVSYYQNWPTLLCIFGGLTVLFGGLGTVASLLMHLVPYGDDNETK